MTSPSQLVRPGGLVMQRSRSFVKKTKKGAVVKVVREHYLRDDVWCGVRGCGKCKHEAPPLETCPIVESDLYPQPHYLVPDTNVVLHQLDVLEDASISNVILLQVVLQEVCLKCLGGGGGGGRAGSWARSLAVK